MAATARRRLLLVPIVACMSAVALTGCLVNTTPSSPAPPTGTPTPRPTPTLARSPERIVVPTVPAVTPAATNIAPPRPATELRDAGGIIYLGQLDGRSGIVAVNVDGGSRRLLAEGTYDTLS